MSLARTSLVALAVLLACPMAWAEDAPDAPDCCEQPEGLVPVPEYGGPFRCRPMLTGDWCGKRTRLARRGILLHGRWLQVAQGVVDGGRRERWAHTTNLDLYGKFDLTRMRVVPGALVSFRAQSRLGDTVNRDSGLLLPVHTAGAFPLSTVPGDDVPIAITELNWTQMVSETLGFLLGKITTMQGMNEFAGGEGYSQFMNFQFLFPATFAQFAPYSSLAAGLIWSPSPRVSVTSILMNTTDASTTTGFGDFDQGQTWWTSGTFTWRDRCCRPGGVTVGAGYAFNGDFASVSGLGIDISDGITRETRSETWAAYASGWQYVLALEPPRDIDPFDGVQELRGLGVFAKFGMGDKETNPVHWSIAAGLSGRGLIGGRRDDTFGLGYFYNDLGAPAVALGRESGTQGVEAYYRFALARSIGLTLDTQWTDTGLARGANAFLLAARLGIDL